MMLFYIFCLSLIIYYLYTKTNTYWKSRGIPYEKPFLLFGNFYDVVRRRKGFGDVFTDIYKKHRKEPYVGIYILHQPNLMITSPEIIKKILVKDFDKFVNRPAAGNEKNDPLSFHSIFSAQDETWKNVRTKISPVFTSGKMKMMFPLMIECADELVDYFDHHSSQVVGVKDLMERFAVDNISNCAFGINPFSIRNKNSEMFKFAKQLTDPDSLFRNFSLLSFFFAPMLFNFFKLTFLDKEASDYFIGAFKATVRARKEKNIERHDLIDLLNNLKDDEKLKNYDFDDTKMAAQALTFFSAGQGTTASTLTLTMFELAVNQKVQDRLRQEVLGVLERHGNFTYEALQEMKYLDMVLNETWRKYPLTFFLSRRCGAPYYFEETGFTLEKGVPVIIPSIAIQRDPAYFPNPKSFDPERFSDENKKYVSQYTFSPFGEGPRNCIGERFGKLTTKIAIAKSVRSFLFEKAESTPPEITVDPSSAFFVPKGIVPLKVIKL